VGNGPWRKVNGRAMIGADLLQAGELQLYADRAAIWNKIPEDMRKSSMLGAVPAIFPYAATYPEFHLNLTGRRVSRR
jgi:hypothetical protein